MYGVILNYPHWTGNTKCFCSPAHKCESSYLRTLSLHGFVYFLRKTKMVHGRFVDFRHALLGCGFFVHIESASALQNILPPSVCDDCEWVGECLCHVCLLVGCIFACKVNYTCIHTCCKHVCHLYCALCHCHGYYVYAQPSTSLREQACQVVAMQQAFAQMSCLNFKYVFVCHYMSTQCVFSTPGVVFHCVMLQHGKDFEKIYNFMSTKYRRMTDPMIASLTLSQVWKVDMPVRM